MKHVKITPLLLLFAFIISFTGCKEALKKEEIPTVEIAENVDIDEAMYRPTYHFTPKENWMNDPNGMFFLNGKYHLYFQYYPDGNIWGPMHWGHAISTDMISWEEQPIAIYPDVKGYIFSGSAVVDTHNSSGFGTESNPAVVAMYTYHDPVGEKEGKIDYQSQAIAYSLDEGQTFTKYADNPVIKNPQLKDFRDPKIIWDSIHKQWLMVLATVDKTLFYKSDNLKAWQLISDFGEGIGAHEGVWECPDFFPMTVEGAKDTKWVLIQSLNPGGINGGSGTQYFIGDFDGKKFTLDASFAKDLSKENSLWIDYGMDNYAGVTWSNIPDTDGRKLFLGWMSNWEYAQQVPTRKWRSSMTIARELKLVKNAEKYRIISQPVKELKKYVSKSTLTESLNISEETVLADSSKIDFSGAEIQFKIKGVKEDVYTFTLHNKKGNAISFGLNSKENFFFIDRSKSGNTSFSENFGSKLSKAPYASNTKDLEVWLLVDKTSIEIFYNNGETVMTEIFFPEEPMDSFSVKTENSPMEMENLVVNQLKF